MTEKAKKPKSPMTKEEQTRYKWFEDLYIAAEDNLRTGCFWENGAWGGSGGDWFDWWDLQEQFAIMWFGDKDQSDGYASNVKSPEIASRIQSTMQKVVKTDLKWIARPKSSKGEIQAKVAELVLNHFSKSKGFKYKRRDIWYDAFVHGTAYATVDHVVKIRKVKMPKKAADMSEEERKIVKEKKKLVYEEVTMVDSYGPTLTPRRIQEVKVDPDARCIHGDTHNADYYILEVPMNYYRFKREFENKPEYKNIGMVKKIGETEANDDDSFFRPASNLSGDYVLLKYLYHYTKDTMMVVANDILIYDGPLPYRHKQLNLVAYRPVPLPHDKHGIGLVDFLVPVVTAQENIQNLINEYMVYSTIPQYLVQKSDYNEFTGFAATAKPGQFLPVTDTGNIVPLKMLPLSMDVFQTLQMLERDAVKASQIDPTQLGVIQKNATATANIMNREITDAYVNYVLSNFIETEAIVGKQIWSLVKQFFNKKDIEYLLNGEAMGEGAYNRRIRLDDVQVEIDWDKEKINVTSTPGETSFLELDDRMFLADEDPDIYIDPESVQVISKALEIQTGKEMFAMFSPYMVDPSDKQKVAQHPAPWINGPEFLQDLYDTIGLDDKSLIKRSESEREQYEEAMEENRMMFELQRVPGEPGVGDVHIGVHEEFLKILNNRLKEIGDELVKMQQFVMSNPNQEILIGMQALMKEEGHLTQVVQIVSEHLTLDSLPAWISPDPTIQQSQQLTTPQAPMPQGMGSGGGGVMGGAGNMGMGNAPKASGMTNGGPGQLGGLPQ